MSSTRVVVQSASTSNDRPKRLAPKDARGRLLLSFALESRLGRLDDDVSQGDVAADLDVQKARIGRLELGDSAPGIDVVASAAHARVSRGWGLRLLRRVAAEYGKAVVDGATDVHGDNELARLSVITSECTDLPRVLSAALADNELSIAELELLVRESAETADAALEAHARYSALLARRREGE